MSTTDASNANSATMANFKDATVMPATASRIASQKRPARQSRAAIWLAGLARNGAIAHHEIIRTCKTRADKSSNALPVFRKSAEGDAVQMRSANQKSRLQWPLEPSCQKARLSAALRTPHFDVCHANCQATVAFTVSWSKMGGLDQLPVATSACAPTVC